MLPADSSPLPVFALSDTTLIQVRRVIYRELAESLREDIESGSYGAGSLLPSEASLGASFGVSRVTVRKALESLRSDGLVEYRQGLGWMVAGEPIPQSLDALVSIERQLADTGRASVREITDFGFVAAPPVVAPFLGPRVLEVGRVNLVDGQPFARVTVWCREDLGLDVSRADVARSSFYDLLGEGPARAVQTIGAEAMDPTDAELLGVPTGSPALIVRRVTYGADGRVMLVSEHRFPGHLTEFVAELAPSPVEWPATDDDGIGPPGLRLVDEVG
jgi:GntR family transcriptional regulator